MPKQNRLPFNSLVEPTTKKIIVAARKRLGISEGGVIDVWAQFDKAAGAIGTPEIKKAAAALRKLMKEARDVSTNERNKFAGSNPAAAVGAVRGRKAYGARV